jgi:hypothetical protein
MTETPFLLYYDNKKKKYATYFPRSLSFHCRDRETAPAPWFREKDQGSSSEKPLPPEKNAYFSCPKTRNKGIMSRV